MSITTESPGLLVRPPYLHVGCRCKVCLEVTWLMRAFRRAAQPGVTRWRCRSCGCIGELRASRS